MQRKQVSVPLAFAWQRRPGSQNALPDGVNIHQREAFSGLQRPGELLTPHWINGQGC